MTDSTFPSSSSSLLALARGRLTDTLTDAQFPDWPGFSRGKVRDIYDLPPPKGQTEGRKLLIATDRQSAFDKVLAAVPFKGHVLTSTARYGFTTTADIVPNHVLDYPDPNVTLVRTLRMLPVEIVVRDYLTGSTATSLWSLYAQGEAHPYGLTLPEGLRKNAKLPQTVLTPTTKPTDGGHDRPLTPEAITQTGLVDERLWAQVAETALALFAQGRERAAARGLILVDTKYEFGLDASDRLTLADEIHTPDSSRYWQNETYAARHAAGQEPESLDKEFLRLWIASRCDPYNEPIPTIPPATLAEFSSLYVRLYETLTGERFVPPPESPPIRERVRLALEPYIQKTGIA